MPEFVIYLSTESISYPCNDYGYRRGKTYNHGGETFPITDLQITDSTKRYSSKRRAESMARKLFDRCEHISQWHVKETQK